MATKKNTEKTESQAKKTTKKATKKVDKETTAKKNTEKTESQAKKTTKKATKKVDKEITAKKNIEAKTDESTENELKSLESIIKKENREEKREEKKDLKELIKERKENQINLKTSIPVRKIESITVEKNNDTKPERESITLLKEAIKAKSKNVSRPVSVKKRIAVVDENTLENKENESDENTYISNEKDEKINITSDTSEIKKEDTIKYSFEQIEKADNNTNNITDNNVIDSVKTDNTEYNEVAEDNIIKVEESIQTTTDENVENNSNIDKKENDYTEKDTYSKSDIFKREVVIPTNDVILDEVKFNQEEMDDAIKNATSIEEVEENTESYQDTIPDNDKIKELKDKDIKIIETEDELKISTLPEIEKKPVEPYIAPTYSTEKNVKKSNKVVPIVGIIIIIFGLALLAVQCFSSKNNDINEDDFYEIITNENNVANDSLISNLNTNNNISTTTTNNLIQITNNLVQTNNNQTNARENNLQKTNAIKIPEQTNTQQNNSQTNIEQTNNAEIPTPPIEPEIIPPTPPVIPTPPDLPTNNTAISTNAKISYSNTVVAANNLQVNNEVNINESSSIYKTKWMDTLSSIANKELGDVRRWPSIFVLNQDIMDNPDNIVFNKDIKIPSGEKKKIEDMNNVEKRTLYNDYIKVSEVYSKNGKEDLSKRIKDQANLILK